MSNTNLNEIKELIEKNLNKTEILLLVEELIHNITYSNYSENDVKEGGEN